jgi:pimeloyl-ACP methyl ester carboxylesterase
MTYLLTPGKLKVTELFFKVPLDQTSPSSETIRIFARSVTRHEVHTSSLTEKESRKSEQRPWLLWLQGGPGSSCAAPRSTPFINLMLDRGYQILYLDQRGTGLSTPVSAETLALRGDVQAQADYLKLFRADSIINDCEAIRKLLVKDYLSDMRKWTVFGQSFGGFCAFTYLSKYPESLKEVFTAGGVPPIGRSPDEVYRATFRQVSIAFPCYDFMSMS